MFIRCKRAIPTTPIRIPWAFSLPSIRSVSGSLMPNINRYDNPVIAISKEAKSTLGLPPRKLANANTANQAIKNPKKYISNVWRNSSGVRTQSVWSSRIRCRVPTSNSRIRCSCAVKVKIFSFSLSKSANLQPTVPCALPNS